MADEILSSVAQIVHQSQEYYRYAKGLADAGGYNPAEQDAPCNQTVAALEYAKEQCKEQIQLRRGEGSMNNPEMLTYMTYGDECTKLIKDFYTMMHPDGVAAPVAPVEVPQADEDSFTEVKGRVQELLRALFALEWMPKYTGFESPEALKGNHIKHALLQKPGHSKMLISYMLEIKEFDTILEALSYFVNSDGAAINQNEENAINETVTMLRNSILGEGDIRMAKAAVNKYMAIYQKLAEKIG
ncbi:MAG: hypothetical protein IKO10_12490 [Lachnospiraceae bacterium]|nr:hypothetical protein [Lachnospiraceae bacterium]